MAGYPLSEERKSEINSLTFEDTKKDYGFTHGLMQYGIEAVAHFHILDAADRLPDLFSLDEDFVSRYELKLRPARNEQQEKFMYLRELELDRSGPFMTGGIPIRLKVIENNGVFIPKQAYWNGNGEPYDREVNLFNYDYRNRILHPHWQNKKEAEYILGLGYYLGSLEDNDKGKRFARNLWDGSVIEFEESRKDEFEKTTKAGRHLIEYYSGMMNAGP